MAEGFDVDRLRRIFHTPSSDLTTEDVAYMDSFIAQATDEEAEALSSQNECPHPDCGKPIVGTSFCCIVHWKALGKSGRRRIKANRLGYDEALRIAAQYWFPEEADRG